jgi:ribosome-binding factor A
MATQPTHSFRMQRIERMLIKRLAEVIRRELRDPELGMINISHIEVSKDLSCATIFVTTLSDDPKERAHSVSILNKSAHVLRHTIAHESTWRTVPILRFRYDEAFERSQRLVDILANIAAEHSEHKDDKDNKES